MIQLRVIATVGYDFLQEQTYGNCVHQKTPKVYSRMTGNFSRMYFQHAKYYFPKDVYKWYCKIVLKELAASVNCKKG